MHRLLLPLLLVLCAAGCARTPPEQALRDTMAELQAAIERRDAAAVESLLADDFIGPEGLDRHGTRRLAQATFLRFRDVGSTFGPLDVTLQDDHARVRGTAVVTGGAGSLPSEGQVYEFETGWRLVDSEWRMVSAQWRPRL